MSSYIRNSSSKKNNRTPTTLIQPINMGRSTSNNYGTSVPKKPSSNYYQSKGTLNYPPSKSIIKDNNNNYMAMSDNTELQTKDRNNFRIRQTIKKNQYQFSRFEEDNKKKEKQLKQLKQKEQMELLKNNEMKSRLKNNEIEVDNYYRKSEVRKDYSSSKTVGLVGLNNIGNTCFMNSILQCMFNIPDFNEYFIDGDYKKQLNSSSKVAISYAKTIQAIRTSTSRAETPSQLKSAIGAKRQRFSGYAQQDAQQFLAGLLELLSNDLNRSNKPKYKQLKADMSKHSLLEISQEWWKYNREREDSIVCDFFSGQMLSKVICSKCKTQSIAFDNIWDIALNFTNDDGGDLMKMFRNFLREEVISDDYYCNKCKAFKQCTRKLDFFRLPRVLVCQIKRFSYGKWRKVKLNNRVKVYLQLDLESLVTESRHQTIKNPVYDLIGVVNHSGDIDYGHYTAECKNPFNQKWYNFNDSSVNQINRRDSFQSSNPYLLFYYKRK